MSWACMEELPKPMMKRRRELRVNQPKQRMNRKERLK